MATITQTTAQGGNLQYAADALAEPWEDIRNASAATNISSPPTFSYVTMASFITGGRGSEFRMQRSYLVFDTSTIPGGTMTSAYLVLYCTSLDNSTYTPQVMVNSATSPTLTTALSTSDWYTPINSTALCTAHTTSTGWNYITLNNDAYSILQSENENTFVLRDNYYDYEYYTNYSAPSGEGYCIFYGDEPGYVPYIEYTVDTGYGQTVNGIITANYSAVNSFLKTGIDKINGVTG